MRGTTLSNVCESIINDFNDSNPDYAVLTKYMLTAPLTSVACERGFTTNNRLKTKARSCISHEKVAKLIRIIEEYYQILSSRNSMIRLRGVNEHMIMFMNL
jgi:hypothetical protein